MSGSSQDNATVTSESQDQSNATLSDHSFKPKLDRMLTDENVFFWIAWFGLRPAALLGIIGNIVSFWVWRAEQTYNATTFLFKYLAVWDTIFLLLATVSNFIERDASDVMYFLSEVLIYLSQLLSVHTTLLVAVTRWMAVMYPLHVLSWLSKRRVCIACVLLSVWCILLQTFDFLRVYYGQALGFDGRADFAVFVTKRIVGLVVPLLLLLVLSVHMVWRTQKQTKRFDFPRLDVSDRQQSSQHPRVSGDRATGRLTVAVVCISLCCFLAYPMGIVMKIVANAEPVTEDSACNIQCYTSVIYVAFLLQIINSSINVVFYWFFASRFRQLLRIRLACFSLRITLTRAQTASTD